MHPSMIMFLELSVNLTDQWRYSGKVMWKQSHLFILCESRCKYLLVFVKPGKLSEACW